MTTLYPGWVWRVRAAMCLLPLSAQYSVFCSGSRARCLGCSTTLVRMSSTVSPARVALVTAPGLAQYSRPLLGSTAIEVTPSATPAALQPEARLVTWIERLSALAQ